MVAARGEGPNEFPLSRFGVSPRAFVDLLPLALLVHDGSRCVYVTDRAVELMGLERPELEARSFPQCVHPNFRSRALELETHPLALRQQLQIERSDRTPCWVEYTGYKLRGDATAFVIVFLHRIQEYMEQTELVAEASLRDPLTALGNRALLLRSLDRLLQARSESRLPLAVLFLDFDRLKLVNDTLGHAAGDRLLLEVLHRFQALLPAGALLTRQGGDEFIILLPSLDKDPAAVADSLLEALKEPVWVEETPIYASLSVGISLYPQHGERSEDLLQKADRAMYEGKRTGGSTVVTYDEPLRSRYSAGRLQLETDLRGAFPNDEFRMLFQPRVSAESRKIVGAEGLLRWQHPERGLLRPVEFLRVIEEVGLLPELSRTTFDLVLQMLSALRNEGHVVPVSLNVSPRQLSNGNFPIDVTAELARHSIPTELFELEITESPALLGNSGIRSRLEGWRKAGVRISLDDFGRGFSSLERLRLFPISNIKVDGSFTASLPHDPMSRAVFQAAVLIASSRDQTVTAESIETAAQADLLRKLGVHELQGEYFAAPMASEDLLRLLQHDQLG